MRYRYQMDPLYRKDQLLKKIEIEKVDHKINHLKKYKEFRLNLVLVVFFQVLVLISFKINLCLNNKVN
ncbi:hypothetical protein POVCU2_0070510 [Plasmodium ovale curtisi]|uniref:Uncharacterized protein n=1 Tax=Plasmodium ovale curtisi TaxID=864141 RepID=A0A1A8WJ59_PLAOA|nr:hypothetical protein POVCU2_0070510 [Plasmodium ovale curtisi]